MGLLGKWIHINSTGDNRKQNILQGTTSHEKELKSLTFYKM